MSKREWKPLINKMERRLEGWQAWCLSMGGQLVLLNSVLLAMSIYLMSITILPKWVRARIDTIRSRFQWSGQSQLQKRFLLVSWDQICKLKVQGGLGVLQLHSMNLALMTKWWWLLKLPISALQNLLQDKYGPRKGSCMTKSRNMTNISPL